ncbi:3-hydroxyacyl-CoA dehydrogenase [Boseongicola sp. H5]|uniref:3-hydroxyacyl-CoA dehydrogenase n=1 Tax=Boseongicola sp. H5 TaxID=2763261 RepID=UPI001D0A769A|nr:3-hydroxyacyl-CoA dehydrogenase [Boseongicola sp. H5]
MIETIQKAAVIGAGQIGRGWAAVFATAGLETMMTDPAPGAVEAGLDVSRDMIGQLAEAGLCEDPHAAQARLVPAPDVATAVRDAGWVQECGPENVACKSAIFAQLDAAAPPHALLGSSTSGIPGSQFLADLPGRERAIVMHPANPVHAMPVVEIAPSDWHMPDFVERCRAALTQVGQVPVVVNHEVPGFVMNRLQAAVINEAMSLVGRDVISPDDLDRVMEYSIGMRWAFIGPFATMDLNAAGGISEYTQKFAALYAGLGQDLRTSEPWAEAALTRTAEARRAALPLDRLRDRQSWRDRTLLRLRSLMENRRQDDPGAG